VQRAADGRGQPQRGRRMVGMGDWTPEVRRWISRGLSTECLCCA
jgi:hypothetical protein